MEMTFDQKELHVIDYIDNRASVDQLADLFAYLNCIRVSDFTDKGIYKYVDDNSPTYIIEHTDNDEFNQGDYVYWEQIDRYLADILRKGLADDIECAYTFILN